MLQCTGGKSYTADRASQVSTIQYVYPNYIAQLALTCMPKCTRPMKMGAEPLLARFLHFCSKCSQLILKQCESAFHLRSTVYTPLLPQPSHMRTDGIQSSCTDGIVGWRSGEAGLAGDGGIGWDGKGWGGTYVSEEGLQLLILTLKPLLHPLPHHLHIVCTQFATVSRYCIQVVHVCNNIDTLLDRHRWLKPTQPAVGGFLCQLASLLCRRNT